MKAESEYFSHLKKGTFFGAFLSIYFGLNSIHKNIFAKAYFIFQNQIEPRKSSKKSSFFQICKIHILSFHWKKINVVALLDHFLATKECNSNTQVSQKVATCATLCGGGAESMYFKMQKELARYLTIFSVDTSVSTTPSGVSFTTLSHTKLTF